MAYSLFIRAAELGHCKGAYSAANMLFHGKTNEESSGKFTRRSDDEHNRIITLYRQAAFGGIAEAMNALGLMLEDSAAIQTTKPNQVNYSLEALCEAARWYYTATEHGMLEAACNLAALGAKSVEYNVRLGLEELVGEAGVTHRVQQCLTQAITSGHPRSNIFRSALEKLNATLLR